MEIVKGDRVKVFGSWRNNNFTDKNGQKRYDHQLIADSIVVFKKPANWQPKSQQTNTQPTNAPDDSPAPDEDIPF
jgi:single-stranded DNA-binding protein